MGFFLTLSVFFGLTLLFTFILFRLNRIGLSEKKQFQDQIARLSRQKLDLEESISGLQNEKDEAVRQFKKAETQFSVRLEKMEKYQSLVEETEEFLFEMNHDGRFTYANPIMLNRLGYNEEEILEIRFHDLSSPEQLPEVIQFYARQYHQKQSDSYGEWKAINRFGESVWIGLRVHMTFNQEGKIASVKGIARDLSVQKAFENRDRADNGFFQMIFKNFDCPVFVFRMKEDTPFGDATLFWTNEPALSLMDLNWFEVKGINMAAISEELVHLVENTFFQTGKIQKWQTKKKPGSTFQVIASKGEEWLWICLNDITEERRALQLKTEKLETVQKILDNLPVDVAAFTPDQRYIYVNPSAIRDEELRKWIIGKTDEEYVKYRNKNLRKALYRSSKFHEVLDQNKPLIFDDFLLKKDHELGIIMRQLSAVADESGNTEMVIATGANVTQKYLAIEPFLEKLDSYRFSARINLARSHQAGPESEGDNIQIRLKQIDREPTEIFGGIQKEDRFFLYPSSLAAFSKRLLQRIQDWVNLDVIVDLNQSDSQLFFFPRALVELSITYLNSFQGKVPIRVAFRRDFQEMDQVGFEMRFDLSALSVSEQSQVQPKLEHLMKIWSQEGFESIQSDWVWVFKCNGPVNETIESRKVGSTVPILKGKMIFVGPPESKDAQWVALEAQTHGADVEVFDPRQEWGEEAVKIPHLFVWVGKSAPFLASTDPQFLRKSNLKILWLGSDNDQKDFPNFEELIVALPLPKTGHLLLQELWIHAKPIQESDASSEIQVVNPINFDKLLEITQGDKVFMRNLFQSYFLSMIECKSMFKENLNNRNADGLKFLLHKIRATINTFNITDLEIFLLDTIRLVESKKEISDKKKQSALAQVDLMCNSVERQIREFARAQNISIP
ncbi:MAG TPA: PAS domain S-box protein [Catalimonadaceae bacterium]|nr:PAS domain S-box protein [Catalimonadaceae bacterium]